MTILTTLILNTIIISTTIFNEHISWRLNPKPSIALLKAQTGGSAGHGSRGAVWHSGDHGNAGKGGTTDDCWQEESTVAVIGEDSDGGKRVGSIEVKRVRSSNVGEEYWDKEK